MASAPTRFPWRYGFWILCLIGIFTGRNAWSTQSQVQIPKKHPFFACNSEELVRLQKAYQNSGREHDIVANYARQADGFIGRPVRYPPRGGQHNQWYQCDKCEIALKTIDDTHHQCPRCKKLYTGEPYDDVIFSRRHNRNLRQMTTAAWAYAITGQKKYAEYATKILFGYAELYSKYPYHSNSRNPKSRSGGHLFEQTLNEAVCMSRQIAPAYDLIYDSGILSENEHQKIQEGLIRPMLKNIDKHKAGKSNWQSWHNAGLLAGGAMLGESDWIQRAVYDPKNGFKHQMNISVSDDGMWYENSWGYHFYTLSALVNAAESARRLGIDIWQDDTFKKMFTLGIYYTMGNGRLPRLGDDVNSSLRGKSQLMEPAYHAYRDPAILPLLSDKPSFDSILLGRNTVSPVLESRVFAGAGHAILRTEGKAELTAAFTFGPYGGFHGHYDKLSFVFYGYGRELAVDPGRARSQAYRLPIHRNWYKATIGHNAVLVDGQSQKPAAGKLEFFQANKKCAAAVGSCDQAYPGVNHKRLLLLTNRYLLVLDELQADKTRQFDWLYHNRGQKIMGDLDSEGTFPKKDYPGSEYVNVHKHGQIDGAIQAIFEDKDVNTHLTMARFPGTKLTLADGPCSSVTDRVSMVIVSRKGKTMDFVTILEPVPSGSKPWVKNLKLERRSDGTNIYIETSDKTDTIGYFPGKGITVTRDDEILLSGEKKD
jgi:Heparinase II/III-like protein/Alginate lyase